MADINSLTFDEKNPAKTLATLANIDELKAQKFLSYLPLTDYVAVVNSIQNKDLSKIRAIVGKHKLAEQQYHEAIDLKLADQLRKISQMSSHQSTVDNTTTNASNVPTPPTAATSTNTSDSSSTTGTTGTGGTGITSSASTNVGTNTNDISSTGNNVSLNPSGAAPALALRNVVSADSKTGTVAIRDPQTKKINIKSMKDPKAEPEIMALIKNAGL
jgi:hypothetical protein